MHSNFLNRWVRLAMLVGLSLGFVAVQADEIIEDEQARLEGEQVSIHFQSPLEYRDFKREMVARPNDQQKLMRAMVKNMDRAVRRFLPEGHQLDLTITDIDMAGEIVPTFSLTSEDIREVRRMYPPKINFTFTWYDETGKTIISGEEERIERNLERISRRAANGEMGMEQAMMDRWLRELARFWEENYVDSGAEDD